MKREKKGQIASIELEKGVCGRPLPSPADRDSIEFMAEPEGMVEALAGSALEDALQVDVAGSVALAKGLQVFIPP